MRNYGNTSTTTRMIQKALREGPKDFFDLFDVLEVIDVQTLRATLYRMVKVGHIKKNHNLYCINEHSPTNFQ